MVQLNILGSVFLKTLISPGLFVGIRSSPIVGEIKSALPQGNIPLIFDPFSHVSWAKIHDQTIPLLSR